MKPYTARISTTKLRVGGFAAANTFMQRACLEGCFKNVLSG